MNQKNSDVKSFLYETFPHAKCVLNYGTPFQCLVAVMLSAQTTDKAVNEVTVSLFEKYPTAEEFSKAKVEEIECSIKRLGLYKNKAKNLSNLSKIIAKTYQNELPLDFDTLTKLPGVGVKTANVVLAEISGRPAIAVDTHVGRVSKRLGYAKEDDEPLKIEKKLEKNFDQEIWIPLHHKIIFFGREICHAKNPSCDRCKLTQYCSYYKKNSSKNFK